MSTPMPIPLEIDRKLESYYTVVHRIDYIVQLDDAY